MICSTRTFIFLFCTMLASSPAAAFQKDGCGAGDCRDCHSVSKEEVAELLKGKVGKVLDVKRSEVPGLWDVEAMQDGKKIPLYIDFSKSYLISGSVIKLTDNEDLSRRRFVEMNRLDLSKIPLDDAVIIGDPKAVRKIIVFDDPECMFCRKLHPEMEKTVQQHPDIAFFIKMFPLAMHPQAKTKAEAILCASTKGDNSRAAVMLSDALRGGEVPAPDCKSDQVEKNIALAKELHISSTPTLIMPDGRVLPGYKKADDIVKVLEEK
jgi:thiol:disulfide interchange protein DsbC